MEHYFLKTFQKPSESLVITFFIAWLSMAPAAYAALSEQDTGDIWLINIDGAIGPATSDYVLRGINNAQAADASLIVLQINTPGGLDQSMRDIIQGILASKVPVVSYVSPKGARAASAGTYIAYASHVSAMSPATNLGAATPVQIASPEMPSASPGSSSQDSSSQDSSSQESFSQESSSQEGEKKDNRKKPSHGASALEKKMINDAAAYIISLARLRGRNADWAELAVREGVSIDATTALQNNVIDIIADNLDALLEALDGTEIAMESGTILLDLKHRQRHAYLPDLRVKILSVLTNPNMVLVLGMLGIYGIILEFYNPGSLVPGVVGVICLLLAAYAVQLLPLNYAGLALLVVGIVMMVAEAFMPSFGILGIGGIVAFSIGGLMLFDSELEAFQVGWPVLGATAVVSALLIFASVNIALKVRRNRVTTGVNLLGQSGEALSSLDKEGQVKVGGEIWRATSHDDVAAGDQVTVVSLDGLLLTVKKVTDA